MPLMFCGFTHGCSIERGESLLMQLQRSISFGGCVFLWHDHPDRASSALRSATTVASGLAARSALHRVSEQY
jgi:hypothetical protein